MNSTKRNNQPTVDTSVWEICKFWILQNFIIGHLRGERFERYVNFEFYKTLTTCIGISFKFERYVNFEFYKTSVVRVTCEWLFERYVNFEFYKTDNLIIGSDVCLRDM